MPRLPDDRVVLARLEESLRRADWHLVARLTDQLNAEVVSDVPEALTERLERLQNALVTARIARSRLAVSLSRARAAASFTHARGSYE
jgi:hypothetical protein